MEIKRAEVRDAPGPSGHPQLGCLPELRANPLRLFIDCHKKYGDVVRLPLASGFAAYLVSHPEAIRHVLQDNYTNYTKGYARSDRDNVETADQVAQRRGFLLSNKLIFGNGLLSSEGDLWRRQRRLMQPAFSRHRLAGLVSTMSEAIEAMLPSWRPFADSGRRLDLPAEMMHLALTILLKSMFSLDIRSADADAVDEALSTYLRIMKQRGESLKAEASSLNPQGPSELQEDALRKAVEQLEAIVYRIIDKRRQSEEERDDLLAMLLSARDEETGEGMDDRQLRDEILTMFMAGQETTSTGISWTWYVLSRFPEVERQVHDELSSVLDGRAPVADDLPRLVYLRQVLEESMRVYPPVWFMMRTAAEDDTIGGYHVPFGSDVIISPYIVHHHAGFWPDPERFDPERFAADTTPARPRFAYMPFGGGPRLCIGNHFAITQSLLVIATCAQKYRLRLAADQQIEPRAIFTLVPDPGLEMTLEARG